MPPPNVIDVTTNSTTVASYTSVEIDLLYCMHVAKSYTHVWLVHLILVMYSICLIIRFDVCCFCLRVCNAALL